MNAKYLALAILIMVSAALVVAPAIRSAGQVWLPSQPVAVQPGAAQTEGRAALIVQFGDGSYVTRCVSFAGDSIAGLELLARSGLEASLWGGAVCRIQHEGCDFPTQPCFCHCKGSSCQYWSYWHWRDNRWAYSQIGSGDYQVHDGNVEAWLWGDAQTPPVTLSFAEICGSSPAATAAAGETPLPSAQPSALGRSWVQYIVFLVMATALVASFWLLRGRQRG